MRLRARFCGVFGALTIGLVVAAWGVAPVAAQTAHPTGTFILTNGTFTSPNAIDHPWTAGLTDMFATIQIRIEGARVSGSNERPVTHPQATGTERMSVTGTYDEATGVVTASFAFTQHLDFAADDLASTWDVAWNGSVTGTVSTLDAPLTFSGTLALECAFRDASTPCNASSNPLDLTVTFSVTAIAAPRAKVLVSGSSGPVYWSGSEESDVEPAARKWTRLEPGQRVALPDTATVRTGRGGTVKLSTGHQVVELGQSTVFTIYTEGQTFGGPPPTWTEQWEQEKATWRALVKGIASYYSTPASTESNDVFGGRGYERSYPQRAGDTEWKMKVTEKATTVTATRNRVVVEHVTGPSVVLRPGESVTSTEGGLAPVRR